MFELACGCLTPDNELKSQIGLQTRTVIKQTTVVQQSNVFKGIEGFLFLIFIQIHDREPITEDLYTLMNVLEDHKVS